MTPLRAAYLALSGGLLGFGGIFVTLGLRRHVGRAPGPVRAAMVLALVIATAGLVAVVILEARAGSPW